MPFPAGPNGFAAWADGNSLGISVGVPDKHLASDFVTSMVDEESWQVRFDLGLPFRLPPNIKVINSSTFRELWSYVDVDMIMDVMLGEKALTPLVPRQADAFRIAYNVMDTEVENAVRGDITVEKRSPPPSSRPTTSWPDSRLRSLVGAGPAFGRAGVRPRALQGAAAGAVAGRTCSARYPRAVAESWRSYSGR